MLAVSNEYKQTMREAVRPQTLFKAVHQLTNVKAQRGTTVSSSASLEPWSGEVFSPDVFPKVITLERDYFRIGTNQVIRSNGTQYDEVGGITTEGLFTNISTPINPYSVVLTLEEPADMIGITVDFYDILPTVELWINGTFIDIIPFSRVLDDGLTARYYMDTAFADVSTIELRTSGVRTGHDGKIASNTEKRVRISSILYGTTEEFTNADILSTTHRMFVDPVSSRLPENKLTMVLENFEKSYNPDNPQGTWEYFQNGQQLEVKYGVQTPSSVEWLQSAKLFLSDAPNVDQNRASFEATDRLSTLTETYYKGVYTPSGATLYDLAVAVLEDAGIPSTQYDIPTGLKNYTTVAPLPTLSHKECLQLIANAGRCVLFCDNYGVITMKFQLDAEMTIGDNGHAVWSNVSSAYHGASDNDYITFEPNRWTIGNESRLIMPTDSSEYENIGYVSSSLSDENGDFSEDIVITINYSLPVTSDDFSLVFDELNDVYATDFSVVAYDEDNEPIETYTVVNNDSTTWENGETIQNLSKIVVTVSAINKPYNRLKITSIGAGEQTDYCLDYATQIDRPHLTRRVKLRQVDVAVHEYAVDEDVTELVNETVEPGSHFISYLPSTNLELVSGDVLNSWTIECFDYTVQSDGTLKVTPNGATTAYEWIGYRIPVDFSDFDSSAYMNVTETQRISTVPTMNTTVGIKLLDADYNELFANYYPTVTSYTTPSIISNVKYIEVLQQATTTETVYYNSISLTAMTSTWTNVVLWQSSYDNFCRKSADIKMYANGAEVVATEATTVVINGNVLLESDTTYSLPNGRDGEICPIDNPLITDTNSASVLADWIASYCELRDTYETNVRQDFRLQANDVIYMQTEFENMVPARIHELTFNLTGQQGQISVKRLGHGLDNT